MQRIVDAIEAAPGRVIGFDRYMQIALYEPGLGYYTGDNAIFGAGGDFVTAPESGVLFARCLARQCAEILDVTGGVVIEYGAGSGRLAAHLLTLLGDALDGYHIIEPSARLRERQRALIAAEAPAQAARVVWHERPPAQRFSGVVIANEVLDALPARRYVVEAGAVHELGVGLEHGELVWRVAPAAVPAALAAALAGYAEGYTTEALPGMSAWVAALGAMLERGVALICDYGYAGHEFLHPARSSGTLKCHYRHQVHDDPFRAPGIEDLTTAVNFSDLAETADAAGLTVGGFTTLTRFLIASGIERELAAAARGDAAHDYTLAQEAKLLLLPGEMGQTCKLMALARDYAAPLSGFAADERHRLAGFVAGGAP